MFKAAEGGVYRRVKATRFFGSGGGFGAASLVIQFTDAGSGIANIVPLIGTAGTFTRATVAWTKLSTGLWGSVASGSPRFCYSGADTTVQTYGGYFPEIAGTQLVTPTASIRDMTATWVATNITPAKTATGIDGAANACTTLTATAPNGTILQTKVAAATNRTYSCFMRRKTGSGTILIQQNATTLDVTALINNVTYTRIELAASVLDSAFGILIATSGDALEVDVNQFEPGGTATSPMASAGAARNADVATIATAGNIDLTNGTSVIEAMSPVLIAVSAPTLIGTAITGRISYAGTLAIGRISSIDSASNANSSDPSFIAANVPFKTATTWGSAQQNLFLNGVAAAGNPITFSGTYAAGANLGIGCLADGSRQWMGLIKSVRIWPNKFTNTQAQVATL